MSISDRNASEGMGLGATIFMGILLLLEIPALDSESETLMLGEMTLDDVRYIGAQEAVDGISIMDSFNSERLLINAVLENLTNDFDNGVAIETIQGQWVEFTNSLQAGTQIVLEKKRFAIFQI